MANDNYALGNAFDDELDIEERCEIVARELDQFSEELVVWRNQHLVAGDESTPGISRILKEYDWILDVFSENIESNCYGPVACAFYDLIDRPEVTVWSALSQIEPLGKCLHMLWLKEYKRVRLLLEQLDSHILIDASIATHDDLPIWGNSIVLPPNETLTDCVARLTNELLRASDFIKDCAAEVRCTGSTYERDRISRLKNQLSEFEDVATDWEDFYEFLKGGNVLGLRKASKVENLEWFVAVLEYGCIAYKLALADEQITSAIAVDVRRLLLQRRKEESEAITETSHSPEFNSVIWYGTRHTFTKGNQSQAVRVLWEAWEQGEYSLSQETIGELIGSSADRFEMRKTFRRRKNGGGYEQHPAWDSMIQQDGKGCYRLVRPETS